MPPSRPSNSKWIPLILIAVLFAGITAIGFYEMKQQSDDKPVPDKAKPAASHGRRENTPSHHDVQSGLAQQIGSVAGGEDFQGIVLRATPVTKDATAVTIPREEYLLREELREVTPTLLDLGKDFRMAPLAELSFPLFDGEFVVLSDVKHQSLSENAGVFIAKIKGEPEGGHVVLSYVRNAISGAIHMPSAGKFYDIRNGPASGQSYLQQVDPLKMPKCGTCADKSGTFVR